MKKLLIACVSLALIGTSISCNKELSSNDNTSTVAVSKTQIDKIGIVHNLGLKNVYDNNMKGIIDQSVFLITSKHNGENTPLSSIDSLELMHSILTTMLNTLELNGLPPDTNLVDESFAYFYHNIHTPDNVKIDRLDLSDEMKSVMYDWLTIIDNESTPEAIGMKCENRLLALRDHFTDYEYFELECVLSIIKSSSEYWYNDENWFPVESSDIGTLGWFNWKRTLKADAIGALGGLIRGIFAPPITLASVASGAVAASAGDAAGQVIDHLGW